MLPRIEKLDPNIPKQRVDNDDPKNTLSRTEDLLDALDAPTTEKDEPNLIAFLNDKLLPKRALSLMELQPELRISFCTETLVPMRTKTRADKDEPIVTSPVVLTDIPDRWLLDTLKLLPILANDLAESALPNDDSELTDITP